MKLPDSPATLSLVIDHCQTLVDVATIVRIEGFRRYSLIHFANGKTNVSAYSIGQQHKRLGEGWVRIHKRHVVAMGQIAGVNYQESTLRLHSGLKLPIGAVLGQSVLPLLRTQGLGQNPLT